MNFLLLFCFIFINTFLCVNNLQAHQCPNYKLLNKATSSDNEKTSSKSSVKCNFVITNPKKIINPYKKDIQNYVQSKPFGSICLKCSMCLAVAKEIDTLFKKTSEANRGARQTPVVDSLKKHLSTLCKSGFENYDLRKVNQYQIVSDEFSCSSHVRTKMDGHWTEKLREMCISYANSLDVQMLLNEYFNEKDDISKYLCSNSGIFRDCANLNLKNTAIYPQHKITFEKLC